MKQFKVLALMLMVTGISFTSCSKEDTPDSPDYKKTEDTNAKVVEIKTTALGSQDDPAEQTGEFVRFSFKEGKIVTTDEWDFAIRGRLIITNGKKSKGTPNVFGNKEPNRTKEVEVSSIIGNFKDIKDIGGLVTSDWYQDYDYVRGYTSPTAPAISFESTTRNSSLSRQPWHLRAGKDGENLLVLRPVVFIFKTQDGHVAKMVIEKMERTNTDFDVKEDITYSIKYYYNPNPSETSIKLDESK